MQEIAPSQEVPTSEPLPGPVEAPQKPKRSRKPAGVQAQRSPVPTPPEVPIDPPAAVPELELVSAPLSVSASTSAPVPQMVIQQLRRRLMHADHCVHYQTREKQLRTALETMNQIARKIGKEDANQRAVLSGLYELLLVIAERFVLLTHGLMQLDAMNHAASLPAIRDARRRYKQVADLQSNRQAAEHLDIPGTLQLLSELSRSSLD